MERIKKTMDGNHAAAYVAYAYTQVAAIYPITPSTVMAEAVDEWSAAEEQNIFGEQVTVVEMQSEAGAAGAVHGSLLAGALTTTFTASQGLLLMIPNLYRIAGERLPGVFHIAARTIATHALSIFGDHSDIYACRQTGVAMLCEASVQEVMDLAPVAHIAAIEGRIPFLNFFDGFRTSHEIQKIDCWNYEDLAEMVNQDELEEWKSQALNPNHPKEMGSAQNPDIYFQTREARNLDYDRLPEIVTNCMQRINRKIGTNYRLFNYYGDKDAKTVIVAMGSVCETIEETIDALSKKGEKVGLIKVHLYRPFAKEAFRKELPQSVEYIQVLDRTKEPGAVGEPLYLDVLAAIKGSRYEQVKVFSGRYGLSSKDTTPGQIWSVYQNREKEHFTIGIEDDVTHLSLEVKEEPDVSDIGTKSCKFWGLGSDGTVGANKNTIKILGDYTDYFVQAYFEYDSKKSGGITISHLRFGDKRIRSEYEVKQADFVACHCPPFIQKYEIVQDIKKGGVFLLNCPWRDEELEQRLPDAVKQYLAENEIQFFVIDAFEIANQIGLGKRINIILQSAFFVLAQLLPKEKAMEYIKAAVQTTYAKKGEEIVAMNLEAIKRGAESFRKIRIPTAWGKINAQPQLISDLEEQTFLKMDIEEDGYRICKEELITFVNEVQRPISARMGDRLPVSAVYPYRGGQNPSGSAAHEKRGVAPEVPIWDIERCIQCNQCSYVCPHAVIRPVVLSEEELSLAPDGMRLKPMQGLSEYKYAITISTLDCTGCGNCVDTCPAPGKALHMKKMEETLKQQEYFDFTVSVKEKEEVKEKFKATTVKGSQFRQPLLEFSGACGGCGETPYAKLVTQLFGNRMFIANATGCSSIWGNSSPSTPYTFDKKGCGPAWANSLFEDAAEFGYGMFLGHQTIREQLKAKLFAQMEIQEQASGTESIKKWLETYQDGEENQMASETLIYYLEGLKEDWANDILKYKDYLSKKSQWVFGGDGWAYDIGFGGLDHVLATGADINVLVFDTEIYSNTGGQASKATPRGAVAQLAAAGKTQKKKKLAEMLMSYRDIYVAQVAMGADKNQCIKAFTEAERYQGPSIIIAYAPCISHGIKKGMGLVQAEEKAAVECGYWINFRYQPADERNPKPVFWLDSKRPSGSYEEFLRGENRFAALLKQDEQQTKELWSKAQQDAEETYERLLSWAEAMKS